MHDALGEESKDGENIMLDLFGIRLWEKVRIVIAAHIITPRLMTITITAVKGLPGKGKRQGKGQGK